MVYGRQVVLSHNSIINYLSASIIIFLCLTFLLGRDYFCLHIFMYLYQPLAFIVYGCRTHITDLKLPLTFCNVVDF